MHRPSFKQLTLKKLLWGEATSFKEQLNGEAPETCVTLFGQQGPLELVKVDG